MKMNLLGALIEASADNLGIFPKLNANEKIIDGVKHYRTITGEWKPCLYSKKIKIDQKNEEESD